MGYGTFPVSALCHFVTLTFDLKSAYEVMIQATFPSILCLLKFLVRGQARNRWVDSGQTIAARPTSLEGSRCQRI